MLRRKKLTWSNELPKKRGWYFFRLHQDPKNPVKPETIVYIEAFPSSEHFQACLGPGKWTPVEHMKGTWAGPIDRPKNPKQALELEPQAPINFHRSKIEIFADELRVTLRYYRLQLDYSLLTFQSLSDVPPDYYLVECGQVPLWHRRTVYVKLARAFELEDRSCYLDTVDQYLLSIEYLNEKILAESVSEKV